MVKMENLRVTFVHPDLGIGGAERLVLDVAVAVHGKGTAVNFVANHFDSSHAFKELQDGDYGVRVLGDWLPRHFFGAFYALCAYVRMLYLAVVYVLFVCPFEKPTMFFVDQIPMAVPVLKWTGKPVIYYCHHPDLLASPPGGSLKKLYRAPIDWVEKMGTGRADVILVNSEYTLDVLHKTFPNLDKKIAVVYPTIASSFLSDLRASVPKPVHSLVPEIRQARPDDVFFLSVNRFHPAKKLELAIEALDVLRAKLAAADFHRVHLIMAGGHDPRNEINDSYFKKLVELTHGKDLVVKVTFLKSPSDKLKADLLKSCHCLLYTPVNEHFGIVPLEAMAASKPVIACDSGGPRETVKHGETGYLCEPTAEDFARRMELMLDEERRRSFGDAGLQRLNERFSYDRFAEKCMDIVNDVYTSNM